MDQVPNVEKFRSMGGRLTHVRDSGKTGRVVTIAYWTDVEAGQVFYGACVFKPDSEQQIFTSTTRKRNTQTAIARFFLRPVGELDLPEDITPPHMADWLRERVGRYGVKDEPGLYDMYQRMEEAQDYDRGDVEDLTESVLVVTGV